MAIFLAAFLPFKLNFVFDVFVVNDFLACVADGKLFESCQVIESSAFSVITFSSAFLFHPDFLIALHQFLISNLSSHYLSKLRVPLPVFSKDDHEGHHEVFAVLFIDLFKDGLFVVEIRLCSGHEDTIDDTYS